MESRWFIDEPRMGYMALSWLLSIKCWYLMTIIDMIVINRETVIIAGH